MNIAIISPEFPPVTNWGGVATFNQNLATLLNSLGHKVFVFALNPKLKKSKTVIKKDYKIIYVAYDGTNTIPRFIIRFFDKWLALLFPRSSRIILWNIFCYASFKNFIKKTKIDIVHSPSYQSPVLFLPFIKDNIKIYLHLHGPQMFLNKYEEANLDNRIVTLIENFSLRLIPDKIITCSSYMKSLMLTKLPRLSQKILTIPNFVINKSSGQGVFDKKRLVFWGRLETRKGADIVLGAFIKAAEKFKDIKLFMIGNSNGVFVYKDQKMKFEQMYNKMRMKDDIRKRIKIIPQISDREKLFKMLVKLKGIALFPSRYEPFGFMTIEAMSLGYVAVAAKKGGGPEIIESGKNGFLIDPDIASAANILESIYNMKYAYLNNLVLQALETIKTRYSLDAAKRNYSEFYKKEGLP